MKTRLQKLMAEANIASRRGAEELIERGRVRVNGQVATLGDKADPETDVIEVDGQRLRFDKQKRVYYALYKPRNVLTTTGEPHRGDERRTVMDFIPYHGHLFTIGRLDADSEGLVILTNDGELTNKLTHPRFRHTKTYKVTVYGLPSEDTLARWEEGVWLDEEGKTAPCSVSIVKGGQKETILRVIMTEGKKRQIRRVAIALGHPVVSLIRTHIGQLSADGLRPGEWRELNAREVKAMSTPSPAIRDIGARVRRRRSEGERQPRERYGDDTRGENSPRKRSYEDRPRQRSLVDGAPGDRFERRPRRDFESDAGRDEDRPRRPRRDSEGTRAEGNRSRAPRREFDRDSRSSDRPRRAKESGFGERSRRRTSDDAPRGEDRPRRRFEGDRREDDRPARRSFDRASGGEDRPRRSSFRSGEEQRPDDRPARRSFDRASGGEDRPRRSSFRSGEEQRPDDRPRTGRKPFGSKPGGAQRRSGGRPTSGRPGGSRPRRDDDPSGRGSSGSSRRSPSQNRNRSSRSGRDEE